MPKFGLRDPYGVMEPLRVFGLPFSTHMREPCTLLTSHRLDLRERCDVRTGSAQPCRFPVSCAYAASLRKNLDKIPRAFQSVRASATWTGLGDEKGFVTDKAVSSMVSWVRATLVLIITGYQYVMTNGIQLPYMIGNLTTIRSRFCPLAQAVHAAGGK